MICWLNVKAGIAQTPKLCQQETFDEAIQHLDAFNNDRAKLALSGLVEELAESGSLTTPFGLRVRMRRAEALEKNNEDELAIQQLLEVAEDSKGLEEWKVYSHAQLSLARLHEKHQHKKHCRVSLDRAEQAVHRHQLDSIYPRLCIRLASYHRLFSSKDSALVFAREVVRTAPIFEQEDHTATGHMLLGMLLNTRDHKMAAEHFGNAARIFKSKGNYSGYSFMMGNLSRLYLKKSDFTNALSYNDSFLVAAREAMSRKQDDGSFLMYYYKGRGEIFEQLGQYDSSLFYFKNSYELRLDQLADENHANIIEIEARFNDEQKARKIGEQEKLLQFERSRKNTLITIIIIAILFALVLAYQHLQLQAASRKTSRQALTISQTNEELSRALEQQIMLQGEIHHRVKNNLQVIISLLDLQKEEIYDQNALRSLDAMSNRIYSMSAIHELLYTRQGTDCISLLEYIRILSTHFSNFSAEASRPFIQLKIDDQCFNIETLMPIGIMLNELMTNSLKYATIPGQQLRLRIQLKACGDGYCLHYQDNGPGFSQGQLSKREGGLGSYLLRSMVRQLNGRMESHNRDGAVFQIFFKEKNKKGRYETHSNTDRRGRGADRRYHRAIPVAEGV
jgi:two-component sensor histidine kinase